MSEDKNSRRFRVGKKIKNKSIPTVNTKEQAHCHIHDKVEWKIEDIRENVCVNNVPLIKYTDEKHYCLFHLPTKEKDFAMFEEVFQARLNLVKEIIVEIEKLPEEQRDNIKQKINYDFRHVWFPSEVDLRGYKFEVDACFSSAIFSSSVNFNGATFSSFSDFLGTAFLTSVNFEGVTFTKYPNFMGAVFSSEADFNYASFTSANFISARFLGHTFFNSATFSSDVNFSSVIFLGRIHFNSATFSSNVDFSSTIFSANAYFEYAIFSGDVNFSSAKFLIQVSFRHATFSAKVFFISTTFSSSTWFVDAEFEELSQVLFRQTKFFGYLSFFNTNFKNYITFEGARDNHIFIGEYATLSLQNARIYSAKKISFHTVRLEPGWFINSDATEFVFTDCKWQYANSKHLDIKTELQNLKNREFENPNALLTKTCWQLAENHEESKSFPEASLFRRMAFESERLGRKQKIKEWLKKIREEFQENIFYWQIISKIKNTSKSLLKLGNDHPFDFIHFLYYWLSGYGEKWFPAFCWLLGVWIIFAFLYWLIGAFGSDGKEFLGFWKSLGYSLLVMTLQRPEPRPYSWITYILYGLETIFAPIQAALFALAIRRKFMR